MIALHYRYRAACDLQAQNQCIAYSGGNNRDFSSHLHFAQSFCSLGSTSFTGMSAVCTVRDRVTQILKERIFPSSKIHAASWLPTIDRLRNA